MTKTFNSDSGFIVLNIETLDFWICLGFRA